jgi:hypothetical protein
MKSFKEKKIRRERDEKRPSDTDRPPGHGPKKSHEDYLRTSPAEEY